ncbi:MAG: hypothetical protein ACI80S_001017 [Pseudohongiellaceae bacterium]
MLLKLIKNNAEVCPQRPYSIQSYRSQQGLVSVLLHVKTAIALLLVFWIATSLSNIFWRWFPEPSLINIVVPVNATAFSPIKPPKIIHADVNVVELKSITLFVKESTEVPAAAMIDIATRVEETALNLKLVGSFANTNKGLGYAIIAQSLDQSLYQVSNQIVDLVNVELVCVSVQKVILNNNCWQEALYTISQTEGVTSYVAP